MFRFYLPIIILLFATNLLFAQLTPEITSWKINSNGAVGYNDIPSNVQQVQYSDDNVYISATCIPDYSIGPWPGDPNIPVNKNFVFKITRKPQQNTGSPVQTPLGHTGIWSNGVSIFNAKDGMTYNNAGIWHQDALFYEGTSFDDCLGHPAPGGEYHHHVNPTCLYDDADSLNHSPIIGYAFDGFPVYGAYGYANTNGTGAIKRMRSSYALNTGTTRLNGPPVNSTYPLGAYVEDYSYVAGSGDLDEHNGRYCITPDYPEGIYAYFVTIDKDLNPVYPYTMGTTYYGTVQAGNTGPNSGHNIITESVTTYSSTSGIDDPWESFSFECYPNPATDYITVYLSPGNSNNLAMTLQNTTGQILYTQRNIQPAIAYTFSLSSLPSGIYFLSLGNDTKKEIRKIIVSRQ